MTDDPGVPLKAYRTHGHDMAVEFRCVACQRHFDVPLETVISRLAERGVGGPETGVREVGRFAERACERCGGRRFETRPSFPRFPGMPTNPWA
jgi:DNA-directed RNA polymerase subunit RPC12/RpoP